MAAESRCSQSPVLAVKLLFASVVKSGAIANVGNFFLNVSAAVRLLFLLPFNIVPVAFKVLFLCQV